MRFNEPIKLVSAIAISELAGIIGSLFTAPSIPGWYASLTRPSFAPPNWVFGPVWTTLFALMGVAAFLVWRKGLRRKDVRIALALFVVQLAFNVLWSLFFFGLHSPVGALVDIVFLWLAIVATVAAFARVSTPAAWLLVPYLAWTSFAAYLNFTFWRLN